MVIWITGKAGAGKTTLALRMQTKMRCKNIFTVVIDGDRIRELQDVDLGYHDEGRQKNITFAANLAKMVEDQQLIAIVSMVSPKRVWRDEARKLFESSQLIYVEGGSIWEGSEYETPTLDEADFIYDWRSKDIQISGNHMGWVYHALCDL
jgi:uridine kinase